MLVGVRPRSRMLWRWRCRLVGRVCSAVRCWWLRTAAVSRGVCGWWMASRWVRSSRRTWAVICVRCWATSIICLVGAGTSGGATRWSGTRCSSRGRRCWRTWSSGIGGSVAWSGHDRARVGFRSTSFAGTVLGGVRGKHDAGLQRGPCRARTWRGPRHVSGCPMWTLWCAHVVVGAAGLMLAGRGVRGAVRHAPRAFRVSF